MHILDWRAIGCRDRLAVTDDRGESYTYGELRAAVERTAGGWAALGVGEGDVVALVARNSAAFLVQALALMRVGALPLFVNWRLTPHELTRLFKQAEPVAVVADPEFDVAATVTIGRPMPDGPPPPRPALGADAVFGLMHTSGTTGRPKIIPLVNGSLIRTLAGFAIEIGDQVTGARHLQLMPLFHLAGFAQAMQCVLTGGTLIVRGGFDAGEVAETIERDRIEFFTAGPSLIDMLVAEVRARPRDLSSLREIQYGSAPIGPASLRAALETLGCRFRQIYGSTECVGFISLLHPDDHRPDSPVLASAGQVVLGWETRIDDGGELLIRGDGLFPGYWRDPEATAAAFDGDWFRTGDIVRITDGYLYVVDRAKDMIISGGENVYPAEVEAVLIEHPDVTEVAVIGVPSERWGEAVHAVVVGTADSGALLTWCRERLAGFKCPKSVELLAELPRNATGKVLKRDLRARYRD